MPDAAAAIFHRGGGLIFACPCRCYSDITAWLGHPLDIRLSDLDMPDGPRRIALIEHDNARILAAFHRADLAQWLCFLAAAAATNHRPEIAAIDTRNVAILQQDGLDALVAGHGTDPFADLGKAFYVADYTAAITERPDTCPTTGRPADAARYQAALQAELEQIKAANPSVTDDLLAANTIRLGDRGWVAVAESDTITTARQAAHAAAAFYERRHPGALVDYAAAEAEVSPTEHPYPGWLVDVPAALRVDPTPSADQTMPAGATL